MFEVKLDGELIGLSHYVVNFLVFTLDFEMLDDSLAKSLPSIIPVDSKKLQDTSFLVAPPSVGDPTHNFSISFHH